MLKKEIKNFEDLLKLEEEVEITISLVETEQDYKDLEVLYKKFKKTLNQQEIKAFMPGEYDKNPAIVTIYAGAGGKDAADWADILSRIYLKWASNNEYEVNILDKYEDESGLRHMTFSIEGEYAYGKLKCEKGIHRLVRISPFDSNKRRHTSFASFNISPELGEDIPELNMKDVKIETFRASGRGGQHVNTTDSAVRVTHLPTGINSSCSNERSQVKNKEKALKVLASRLKEYEIIEREEKVKSISGENKDISWGNQIRSYVFHPYKMVKDHRTNFETSNVEKVLEGEIDQFIDAYLRNKEIKKEK